LTESQKGSRKTAKFTTGDDFQNVAEKGAKKERKRGRDKARGKNGQLRGRGEKKLAKGEGVWVSHFLGQQPQSTRKKRDGDRADNRSENPHTPKIKPKGIPGKASLRGKKKKIKI